MCSLFGLSGKQSASLGVDSFVVHNRAASEGDEYSFTGLYRNSPSGFFEESYPLPGFLTISSQADLRFTIYDLRFTTKVTCFSIMNRLLSEFLGTFFLTLTICVAAVYGKAGDYGPLAIGFVLVAMVYACGHISKAHFNPAVSLAFLIRGCYISVKEMFSFIGVQCLAAILAALLARGLYSDGVIVETTDLIFVPALVAEILFTFMLVWVIMNVATAKANHGNDFYGIAIGFTVAGAVYTVGIVSLAVLNPAVAIALVLVGKLSLSQIAIPIFGSLLGGLGAVLLFNLGHPTEGCSDDDESGCSPIK